MQAHQTYSNDHKIFLQDPRVVKTWVKQVLLLLLPVGCFAGGRVIFTHHSDHLAFAVEMNAVDGIHETLVIVSDSAPCPGRGETSSGLRIFARSWPQWNGLLAL